MQLRTYEEKLRSQLLADLSCLTVSTETQQPAEGAGSQLLLFEMKKLAKNPKASTQQIPHDCESLREDISAAVAGAGELSLQLTNISRNSLFCGLLPQKDRKPWR